MLPRELAQLRILGQELVKPALDVEAGRDARLQELAPRRREAATLRRDTDDRDGRLIGKRVVDAPTIGIPLVLLSRTCGVEDRDDRIRGR